MSIIFEPKYLIADHIRTSCFCIADGVLPSGKQRGYILRRLIRRSLSASLKLNIDISGRLYFEALVDSVIGIYDGIYPEISDNREIIIQTIFGEAGKYLKAINVGQKEWVKILKSNNGLDLTTVAELTWDMYQKSGVPFEVSQDVCEVNNLEFDFNLVENLMKKHQELSRSTSAGQFKSGLGQNTDKTQKLHTTTHLLHQVLRSNYGDSVRQMGSAITDSKARFDFSLDHKIENNELLTIQSQVQDLIDMKLDMIKLEMSQDEARRLGAIGLFGEKYGQMVTVYTLQNQDNKVYSREFCGGPHIDNTSQIGKFIILKEKSVSAGVRRIEFDVE